MPSEQSNRSRITLSTNSADPTPKSSTLRDSTFQAHLKHPLKHFSFFVPNPRFPIVQSDPCPVEKFVRQHVVNVAGALRGKHWPANDPKGA